MVKIAHADGEKVESFTLRRGDQSRVCRRPPRACISESIVREQRKKVANNKSMGPEYYIIFPDSVEERLQFQQARLNLMRHMRYIKTHILTLSNRNLILTPEHLLGSYTWNTNRPQS